MNENLIDISDLGLSEGELFSHVENNAADAEKITAPRYSYWRSVLRVFFKKKINIVILALLAVLIAFSFIYPMFSNYDPTANVIVENGKNLKPLDAMEKYGYNIHWILGSGPAGESVFDKLWSGASISLSFAFVCALINMTIGVIGNLKDYEMAMFTRQAQPQPKDIVGGNTTLRQLDLNQDMLKRNLKLKYTNFMPTLALSFQYMYTSMSENWRIADYKWNPYSTLGLSLSIPLFKGGNFSQVKQAKLQLKQLDQTRINTERQLKMQAQSYLNNMSASTEQVVSNKEAVLQAEKGRTIAEKRYEVGRGTILELNSSEVALTQAQLTYNQSIYDYLVAKADLDLVMGVEDVINVEEEKK